MAKAMGITASAVLLLCGFGGMLSGCGDSSSDAPAEAQLEKAREEGERAGQERARVDELEEEVRGLKRTARQRTGNPEPREVDASPSPPAEDEPELLRSFHAPSGNVSCAITSTGAYCAVASIATTFRLHAGSPGEIESGAALPKEFGELVGFGNTISAGSVTCTIPQSNEPKGIVCVDGLGHGFEASRVSERQKTF